MGRKRDEFWQYVDPENGNKCIFCGRGIPGAFRIKFHLAKVKGGGISGCTGNVPEEVQREAAAAIDNNSNSNKRVKQSTTSNDPDHSIINSNLSSDPVRGKIEVHLLPTTDLVGKEFQSNINKIWEWLTRDEISMIGVWGMGGVGKTALLMHVHNMLVNAKENVIWVPVSQDHNLHRLQKVIAKSIGVHLSEEDDKINLSAKLLDALKRINRCVIILDDVWLCILLNDLGIPLGDNGIRVIITSRSIDVCQSMGCGRNIIKVNTLWDQETWDLFSRNLGDHGTLPSEAIEIAESMAQECDGLPLAIATIARSMRGKVNIKEWENSLSKLESREKGHEDIKRFVFPVLKSSFDHLNDSTLQDCFLQMAFNDDFVVKDYTGEEMTRKLVDEGLINGRQGLGAQLNEFQRIVNKLINNSLLINESEHDELSFHGLVRAMAVSIGKESHGYMVMTELLDEEEWTDDFQKVSLISNNIVGIPSNMSPRCPKLSTFLMNGSHRLKVIPDNFFTNMPALKILDLSNNDSIEGLPMSISNLECLSVLLLACCKSLRHIPSLAKLRRLRKLDLSKTAITEVPQGFENLTSLRWLNLLGTMIKLKAQDLEGLKMLENIAKGFDNKDEFNACVQIIQANINSGVLIRGYFLLLDGDGIGSDDFVDDFENFRENKVILFYSVGNSTFRVPTDINKLEICDCHGWKSICDVLAIHQVASPFYPFKSLRTLTISRCNRIKTLITPEMSTQFQNLEEMNVWYCKSIKKIFSSRRRISREVDIDVAMIPRCHSLEEVLSLEINNEEEEQPNEVETHEEINLPNLKSVELWCLPRLNSVCKGTMLCGSLQKFVIWNCPKHKPEPQIKPPFAITYRDERFGIIQQSHT